MCKRKILIMGLPGSGKTTLARALAPKLQAVHFNADEIRKKINPDLEFSLEDRIKQALRMGWLCDQVVRAGHYAVADFICPTEETRTAFGVGGAFVVWVDRIKLGRFDDTNQLFVPPKICDIRVFGANAVDYWVEKIYRLVCSQNEFSKTKPQRCARLCQATAGGFGLV